MINFLYSFVARGFLALPTPTHMFGLFEFSGEFYGWFCVVLLWDSCLELWANQIFLTALCESYLH